MNDIPWGFLSVVGLVGGGLLLLITISLSHYEKDKQACIERGGVPFMARDGQIVCLAKEATR